MPRKTINCPGCGRLTVGKHCGYCIRADARSRLKDWRPHIPNDVDRQLEVWDKLTSQEAIKSKR